jgi:hypothetical protein
LGSETRARPTIVSAVVTKADIAFGLHSASMRNTQFRGRHTVLRDRWARETLIMRMGYGVVGGQSDFISNIVRWLAEERLNLAVERPAAICHITGLPTTAPTTEAANKAASK